MPIIRLYSTFGTWKLKRPFLPAVLPHSKDRDSLGVLNVEQIIFYRTLTIFFHNIVSSLKHLSNRIRNREVKVHLNQPGNNDHIIMYE